MATVVEHPLYTIEEYPDHFAEGESAFDWTASSGAESFELHETAEYAVRDVENTLGLYGVVVLSQADYDELLDYKFKYEGLTK